MKVARVTISDRATAGIYEDKGGPEIERVFRSGWEGELTFIARMVPDERDDISRTLCSLADDDRCDLVFSDEIHDRAQIPLKRAPVQLSGRLRGHTQRIGERQSDARGAQVQRENARDASRQ